MGATRRGPPRVSSFCARAVFARVAMWSVRCSLTVKEACDGPVSPGAGEGGETGVRPTRPGSTLPLVAAVSASAS